MDFGISIATAADSWKVVKRAEDGRYLRELCRHAGRHALAQILQSGEMKAVKEIAPSFVELLKDALR